MKIGARSALIINHSKSGLFGRMRGSRGGAIVTENLLPVIEDAFGPVYCTLIGFDACGFTCSALPRTPKISVNKTPSNIDSKPTYS